MKLSPQMNAALYYARKNRKGRRVLAALPAWEADTAVLAGDYVRSAGNAYKADHGGTTGATAPTGYTLFNDNGINWQYVDPQFFNNLVFIDPSSP